MYKNKFYVHEKDVKHYPPECEFYNSGYCEYTPELKGENLCHGNPDKPCYFDVSKKVLRKCPNCNTEAKYSNLPYFFVDDECSKCNHKITSLDIINSD